jgi:hypothetical protein
MPAPIMFNPECITETGKELQHHCGTELDQILPITPGSEVIKTILEGTYISFGQVFSFVISKFKALAAVSSWL